MKTKKFFSITIMLVFIFSFSFFFYSVSQVEAADYNFIRSIGGINNDVGRGIIQTSDGGYAVIGYAASYGGSDSDIILTKLNASGTEQWTSLVGDTLEDVGYAVIQTSDSGYMTVGFTRSYGGSDKDLLVTKFNSTGVEQWSRVISSTSGQDTPSNMLETSDGGFVITGDSFDTGLRELYILKINSAGVVQWTTIIGNSAIGDGAGTQVIELSDNSLVISGYTGAFDGAVIDAVLIKLNSAGTEQWTKAIEGSNNDYFESVVETSDNGFVAVGFSQTYGTGTDQDILISKFNSSGVEQWTKSIDGANADWAREVLEMADGSLIITGFTESNGGADRDVYITKLDSSGAFVWANMINGSSGENVWGMVETSDGGFAIAGQTTSYGGGGDDFLIAKLDSLGEISDCTDVESLTFTLTDETITEVDETGTGAAFTMTDAAETLTEVEVDVTGDDQFTVCSQTLEEDTLGLGVSVSDVIALDCGADIDFGTIDPGTPTSASTTCTITTNAENGYAFDVKREDSDTTMDHTTDATANIPDITVWNGANAAEYASPGLAFRLYDGPDTGWQTDWDTDAACPHGTSGDADYAGFPASYVEAYNYNTYSETSTTVDVCYIVDISSSQKSGSYDGVVTYQVYTNP